MSTEQVDPQLIEQTKQQIRGLVVEIAQLAKQQVDAREFYGAFLDRVVSALAAVGGAVWTLGDAGSLELQYQINFRETRLADNQQNLQRHGMLLQKTMAGGEGLLVAPAFGRRRRRAGRQSDRLPADSGADQGRPGIEGSHRSFSAGRSAAYHAAWLPQVPAADVRAGQRLSQEPPAPAFH